MSFLRATRSLALLTAFVLPCQTRAESASGVKTPAATADALRKILPKIPGTKGADCLVSDFLDVVGIATYAGVKQTQSGNDGLVSHFKGSSAEDPKLAQQLHDFYGDVDTLTKLPDPDGDAIDNRPFLKEEAGDKDNAKLAPGWAWNLALKDAGGDPNRPCS